MLLLSVRLWVVIKKEQEQEDNRSEVEVALEWGHRPDLVIEGTGFTVGVGRGERGRNSWLLLVTTRRIAFAFLTFFLPSLSSPNSRSSLFLPFCLKTFSLSVTS